jgi:hypothetical protein
MTCTQLRSLYGKYVRPGNISLLLTLYVQIALNTASGDRFLYCNEEIEWMIPLSVLSPSWLLHSLFVLSS